MSAGRQRSEEVTINLTPMIDVVFLLVIFFMVGSKFSEAESRIRVNVPSVGEMRSMARAPDRKVVSVGLDGTISLDDVPLTMGQLTDTLRQQYANYPAVEVVLRADADGSYQQAMEVLHAIKISGVEQIGLSTQGLRR